MGRSTANKESFKDGPSLQTSLYGQKIHTHFGGYSPFLHYPLVPSLQKSILEMQVTRTPLRGVSGYLFLARLHEVHRAIAVTPVVHVPVLVPVPVRVRVTLALKFSRSPYLDNHSSESIHT